MSTITILASGPSTAADELVVVLVETEETPPAVLMHWPAAPSVAAPPRFPAAALAVIAVMDTAMTRLAEIQKEVSGSPSAARSL
jgi:hypothetical protein